MPITIAPSGVGTAYLYNTQTTAGLGYTQFVDAVPPSVNTPIFYEPGPVMSGDQLMLWIVVSAPPPTFGGAQVWSSLDNSTYGQIGIVGSGATQGVLTATFPAGSDPDTTDTLSVNVSESTAQTINPGSNLDADLGITLAYVNGSTPEMIGYSAATLTSPANYNLGTYIRRGMFGTANASHASGANFALLNGGVFRYVYTSNLVGRTLYFKFPSFNTLGGQLQALSSVPFYTYTLTGVGLTPVTDSTGCPTTIVLAGGAASIDWGALDSTCVLSCADWGHLTDPLSSYCIDEGHL